MSAIPRIHSLLFLPLAAVLLTACSLPAADNRETPTVQAVRQVMPSVVNIATETIVEIRDPFSDFFGNFFGYGRRGLSPQTTKSLGSGVIIDEEGYLLTNEHVVRRADQIWVKVAGAEYPATRIAGDAKLDVALVKINAPEGARFVAATFAGDDDLMLGETVLALGNPFGLGGSVSRGILSSKSRRQPLENQPLDLRDWLQTDAAINPGNSGGPLINLNGELIGLNVAVYGEGQGIGFAIPISRVRESISTFLSPEQTSALWFGARVDPGRNELEVSDVEPNSPAAIAGLQKGDRIELLNGEKPRSFIGFTRSLLSLGTNDPVKLMVLRQGRRQTVSVHLISEKDFFDNGLLEKTIGIQVQPNTPRLIRQLGMPPYHGFVITDVKRDSAADKAGLRPEQLVLAVDERQPRSVTELAKYVFRKSKGDKLNFYYLFPKIRGRYVTFHEGRSQLNL